jgi:hypothetical protein
MMEHQGSKALEARQRADDKFAKAKKRDAEVMNLQRQHQNAEQAKFQRLRALRLAKEAADRENLAKLEAEAALTRPKAKPRKAKRPKTEPANQETL